MSKLCIKCNDRKEADKMEQTAKESTLAIMAEHAGDPTPMELFHMHVKHEGINTKSKDEAL